MRFLSTKNSKILKLASIGMASLFISALVIVTDPLHMFMDWQLTLRSGSLLHKLWLKPPLEVYVKLYMFNFTNTEAYLSGADEKMHLEEIGPYVYQEVLENTEVIFNDNNTVTFHPKHSIRYVPEKSASNPYNDKIVTINIPYMGITSAASDFGSLASLAVSAFTSKLNEKEFIETSVYDYLWNYENHLIKLASRLFPSIVHFDKFGIMDRILDEGYNIVTIKLPEKTKKKGVLQDYAIDNYNGEQGIKYWENENHTLCNTVTGSHEGTLFPRNIKEGDSFRVYRKAFCRSLPIVYSHSVDYNGIKGYNFKMPLDAFDSDVDDPNTSCYCRNKKCLKKGLGNATPCYYNVPLAMSFPHFLGADPTLSEPFEGLKPDENIHTTDVIIQQEIGIPMSAQSRVQINLVMNDIKYNRALRRFSNMTLPILWADIGVEKLSSEIILLLKLLFQVAPFLQIAAIVILILVGVTLTSAAIFYCFCTPLAWTTLSTTIEGGCTLEPKKLANSILPLLKQPVELQVIKSSLPSASSRESSNATLLRSETDLKSALIK